MAASGLAEPDPRVSLVSRLQGGIARRALGCYSQHNPFFTIGASLHHPLMVFAVLVRASCSPGARSSESSCREDKVCWPLPRAARAGLELLTRR